MAHTHDRLGIAEDDHHDHDHDHHHGSRNVSFEFQRAILGGLLVVGSFLVRWLYNDSSALEDNNNGLFYSNVLAIIGTLMLAIPLWKHAIECMLHGHMHMDELVALAILAAIATGDYQAAGVVAFFLLLSNLIEEHMAAGARADIEKLIRLTPTKALRLLEDGSEEEVDAPELRPGDTVVVRPGDNIPADGQIIKGHSTINEANITGESLPVEKAVGEEVFGGTSNVTGALQVKVTKAGSDTTLERVKTLIGDAGRTKIPLMRMIDEYASWYTPVTLMLAGVVWFFTRDMSITIAMLVLACPCALILATPTAIVAALATAARLGIYIKDASNIEWARKLTAIVFDKTGTLTTGELSVTKLRPGPGLEPADVLATAASVESLSTHPVARAITAVARKASVPLEDVTGFEEVGGKGVKGVVGGDEVWVGRRIWVEQLGADLSSLAGEEYAEPEGISILYVVRNGQALGWIGLEDRTRPEASAAMDELREMGLRDLVMVTGDRWSVARRVAKEMGCSDVQAEVLPQDKLALVNALKEKGHTVAVVGDGVNDAPALKAGHLGLAMGAAGSDVAIDSASIALMSSDLRRLPFMIGLSRRTTQVIWQNLIFGVGFIMAGEILIVFKFVGPMGAALLHTLSSAIVVFNSARIVRYGEEIESHVPMAAGREEKGGEQGGRVSLQPVA